MSDGIVVLRSSEYGEAKAELWHKYRTELTNMLSDLINGDAFGPDFTTDHSLNMAINARFRDVTGDCGKFIGTIPEIMREAGPIWKKFMDAVFAEEQDPAFISDIGDELNELYGDAP